MKTDAVSMPLSVVEQRGVGLEVMALCTVSIVAVDQASKTETTTHVLVK